MARIGKAKKKNPWNPAHSAESACVWPYEGTTAMRKILLLLAGALVVLATGTALAQAEQLQLDVHRTFGYGLGSQIQGNFRLEVTGPVDLTSVTFTLDGERLATDPEAPFETRLITDDYAPGWHTLTATGGTAGGQTLTAPVRRFEFVSASQVRRNMSGILGPVAIILALAGLVGIAGPLLQAVRGRVQPALPLGAPRDYGPLGGTICPKCHRPFGRHWWGFNLITGKLDRCPHCGRWSIVRALPRDVLAQAEAAELADAPAQQAAAQPDLSEAEQRRRAIEESRFDE
jgi:hypothetical protein